MRNVYGDYGNHLDCDTYFASGDPPVRHRPGSFWNYHDDGGYHGVLHASGGSGIVYVFLDYELSCGGDYPVFLAAVCGHWSNAAGDHFPSGPDPVFA